MSDITKEIELTDSWKNITALLDATKSYYADIDDVIFGASVYQVLTTDLTPPSIGLTGHPWRMTSVVTEGTSRVLDFTVNTVLWMRTTRATARLIVTER